MKKDAARKILYLGEGIKAQMKRIDGEQSVKVDTTDISPWSLVLFSTERKSEEKFNTEEKVNILFKTVDRQNFKTKAIIKSKEKKTRNGVQGTEYLVDLFNYIPENPESVYFTIGDFFQPVIWCEDPFFFEENIIFKLTGFHPSGLLLLTSARNKSFVPGVILSFNISIPLHPQIVIKMEVKGCTFVNEGKHKDKLFVYCVFVDKSDVFLEKLDNFLSQMVEYLLFCNPNVSISELKKLKLPTYAIERSIHATFACNKEDYQTISNLRKNHNFVKEIKDAHINVNEDIFDKNAEHILFKVGSKKIASLRLHLSNKNEKESSELFNYSSNFPDWLWGRKFVEITRITWEAGYIETEVFTSFMKHLVRIVMQTNNTYIAALVPLKIESMFLKVGFQHLNFRWKQEYKTSFDNHTILVLDSKSILNGEFNIDRSIWDKIFYPVANYLNTLK